MNKNKLKTYLPTKENQVAPFVHKTSIEGLLYLDQTVYTDNRGFFSEVIRLPEVEAIAGIPFHARQVNHARSEQNVIRGIHAEGWNKCTFVTRGKAFCALVDVRPDSKTFRAKEFFIMGEGEEALKGVLFISSGIGNSLCVLDGPVDYIYIVDRLYKDRDPAGDQAISLFDPDLSIPWPIQKNKMVFSKRDEDAVTLRQKYPNLIK